MVLVYYAATAEASVSGLKRPPTDEGTPSTKRRDAEDKTSPEGIVQWVVRLILVGLFGVGLYSESLVWTSMRWLPITV